MNTTARRWLLVAGIVGALSVVLGAFGAHGVPSYLESQGFEPAAVDTRLDDFHTAARYHTYGALFLAVVAVVIDRRPSRLLAAAAWCMLLGVVVFSGAVYAVALVSDALRPTFGMLAPVGGTLMIVAWALLAASAMSAKE